MEPSRKLVIVVDDHPSILRALGRLLSARGFDTELYDSAEDFQAHARPDLAACIVLDMDLQGKSGIEVKRQLTGAGQATPVIFITADDSEAARKGAIEVGCSAYLIKPVSAESLLAAIERASAEARPASGALTGKPFHDRRRKVFDHVHHPYLLLAPDLTILDANTAFLRVTMTDLERIARRDVSQIFPRNPNDPEAGSVAEAGLASLRNIVTTKLPHFMPPHRYDIRRRDGTWERRHWRSVNLPVLDDRGEVEFIISAIEDVTGLAVADYAQVQRHSI